MAIDWFPLWLSLRVALLATSIATVGGLAVAYLLANRDFRGKETLDAALTLPLVLPPTEDIKADEFQAMLIVAGERDLVEGKSCQDWVVTVRAEQR